jgi:hypothetical protein
MEYFEIPFEGTVLPGYFRKAAAGTKPAKTLIMIGGGETFAEDLVFYIAPQTAMNDPRIKAVAVTSAVVDAERLFATMPVATTTPKVLESFASFHCNVVKLVAYRWGVKMDNIPGLVAANKGFTFDPAKVTCPMLLLVGAGEYADKEVQRQQKECMDKLPNPKSKLVVTGFEEGASSHCIGENRSLMGEILFDWLDDVLK